jgi:DNA polymerase IV (DinB-like DNA polymerase)
MSAGASGNLPGVAESESPDRIIVHIDMDCFYAACERLREPALRGEPVVIGMGYDEADPHGAVATASYEAREFGVESAMPISEALEHLPRRRDVEEIDVSQAETGYYRPVDMEFYESVSTDVQAILETYADTFEPVSIDEAYLDVTSRTEWDTVTEFARAIKQEITDDVGVTASVGVAPTKSAAKVASDQDKPDGLVVVLPGTVAEFFAPLDVEDDSN